MAKLVKCPTPYISSSLDLKVVSLSPALGSMMAVELLKNNNNQKKNKKQNKT